MLNEEVRLSIDKSVLCWLATASADNTPNVSPKEIFMAYGASSIIIANIASPQSIRNIVENEKVCVSFIDILVQKGFQVKGNAKIIKEFDAEFSNMKKELEKKTKGKFPFSSIININISGIKKIIAPAYVFYPDTTTEETQVASAKKTYGL